MLLDEIPTAVFTLRLILDILDMCVVLTPLDFLVEMHGIIILMMIPTGFLIVYTLRIVMIIGFCMLCVTMDLFPVILIMKMDRVQIPTGVYNVYNCVYNSPDYGNDYVSYYIEDTGYAYTDVWVYTHSYGTLRTSMTNGMLSHVAQIGMAMLLTLGRVAVSHIPTETKTPSTFLHVLGVIYVKREEMTLQV